ncbi:MAG TPA: bacillithiol transferase BstA [Bryobacteraceae bacterium]|jgi:hypothetical protein|nr:bacillithiol transferase BstA [Bryobacteraceae bacterium]
MEDLRYPTGRYTPPAEISASQRDEWIEQIAAAPANLRQAVEDLSDQQLDRPYRVGGWTSRQITHHLPDSHLNAYVRFRLALTEDTPIIKPYEESRWATLPDAKSAPIQSSLDLLEALHHRWVLLLTALSGADYGRTFRHPELGEISLDWTLGLYAWHGRHHTAQIQQLRKREDW